MENNLKVKVYYKDTDAEGVAYYATYLGWFEMGRTELIRDMGISLKTLKVEKNIVFAVREVHVKYLLPAMYDDEILIRTKISGVTGATVKFDQKIYRGKGLLCDAEVILFALDLKKMKPTKIPEGVKF
ncbi:MAG: YbgC/FadM family acyl-CoA thioesterase [Candidatus Saganbacteria bacterium]|nr:YbgC/FadM family acyl-CoA thioesterase [Candidatus Saganbacteria bacterium]